MEVFFIIFGVALIIVAIAEIIYYFKLERTRTIYDQEKEEEQRQLIERIEELTNRQQHLILEYDKDKQNYIKDLNEYKMNVKSIMEQQLDTMRNRLDNEIQTARIAADNEINTINQQVQSYQNIAATKRQDIQTELDKMRASLNAGTEARLREQKTAQEKKFYQIQISQQDLEDIEEINKFKKNLHNPVILSKLVWTQYFQKPVSALCNRVFGTQPVSGIYKITNILSDEVYIGQSVDIASRIKTHCKCGLGIDAPQSNKLYNNMQNYGLQYFTFQLLEKCSRELLNEKEAFWIDMYESNKFGLNTTKGNTK